MIILSLTCGISDLGRYLAVSGCTTACKPGINGEKSCSNTQGSLKWNGSLNWNNGVYSAMEGNRMHANKYFMNDN